LKIKFFISLIFGVLIGCGNGKTVSDIIDYVTEINNRTDLTESISEFDSEDLNDKDVGGISIYELTDSNGNILRIVAEIVQTNNLPINYEFYFKNDTLTFARVTEWNETGSDTIMNSDYYFDKSELIKQVDRKDIQMDAETVIEVSEFYLVYGKSTE